MRFSTLLAQGDAGDPRVAAIAADAEGHRPDQHPVHQRHHRLPQGRHADAPQHPEQRLLHRRVHEAHAGRPAVHSGAAVPLLRHGAGQPGLPHPRRHHGLPQRRLRSAHRAADGAGRELHRPARRAHHVHRRAGPSALQGVRSVHAAHRHHGRLALPDRGDEARGRATCTCPRSPLPTA